MITSINYLGLFGVHENKISEYGYVDKINLKGSKDNTNGGKSGWSRETFYFCSRKFDNMNLQYGLHKLQVEVTIYYET